MQKEKMPGKKCCRLACWHAGMPGMHAGLARLAGQLAKEKRSYYNSVLLYYSIIYFSGIY